jgi:hypothetical protein
MAGNANEAQRATIAENIIRKTCPQHSIITALVKCEAIAYRYLSEGVSDRERERERPVYSIPNLVGSIPGENSQREASKDSFGN